MRIAGTNGHVPTSAELREERLRLVAQRRLLREQRRHNLTEDIGWDAWPDYRDFGGSDLFYRARGGSDWIPLPPAQASDRQHGQKWPLWRNEAELFRILQQSRLLLDLNPFAQGLLRNRRNYTIGKGFAYKSIARNLKPGAKPSEDVADKVRIFQRFVDEFLQLNRWNAVVDRRNTLIVAATREQELYNRIAGTDGEAFVMLHQPGDGRTHTRFLEPETIRTPPGGIVQHGWIFGILHQMQPFEDIETPEAYFKFWQDMSSAVINQDAKSVGEEISADKVIHFKGPDTPAAIARGISPFSFEVARSLERALKLQRNISVGAADRAATSEIIQYRNYSQAQISAYVGGQANTQEIDPITGNPVNIEARRPGMRRNIPMGMEFVQPPADNSTPAFMEALAGDIRQGCVSFAAPEYWGGDASNGSYASLSEASAPPVKNGESEQEYYKTGFAAVIWKAARHAMDKGLIPQDIDKVVDLQVEAPAVLHRDKLEKAQADQIAVGGGWKSPQTCAMEDGLDPDTELTNTQEFHDQVGQPGDKLPMPDDGDDIDRPPLAAGDGKPAKTKADDQGKVPDPSKRTGLVSAVAALQADYYAGKLPREAVVANVQLLFGMAPDEALKLFPEVAPKKLTQDVPAPGMPFKPTEVPVVPKPPVEEKKPEPKVAPPVPEEVVEEVVKVEPLVPLTPPSPPLSVEELRRLLEAKDASGHQHAADGKFGTGGGSGKKNNNPDKVKHVGALVSAAEHAHADMVSNRVAKKLGGLTEEQTDDAGQKDKKPYDVRVPKKGGGAHDIEIKSLLKGEKQGISMHEDALLRKVNHAALHPENVFHVVVSDERDHYGGGEFAENFSGHTLYYKRGAGKYTLAQMHPVKNYAELKTLLDTPDDKLPDKARGSIPPPPPIDHLKEAAAKVSESRKKRDKARKEKNKDKLREQARARAEKARQAKVVP